MMLIETHEGYLKLIQDLKSDPSEQNVDRAIIAITELFAFYQTNKELQDRYRHLLVEAMQITTENVKLDRELQEAKNERY